MLKTKGQFQKFVEKNNEGRIFIYPDAANRYMLIIFKTGVIEYIEPALVRTLQLEGVLFPFVCHSVDRNKLKKKEVESSTVVKNP